MHQILILYSFEEFKQHFIHYLSSQHCQQLLLFVKLSYNTVLAQTPLNCRKQSFVHRDDGEIAYPFIPWNAICDAMYLQDFWKANVPVKNTQMFDISQHVIIGITRIWRSRDTIYPKVVAFCPKYIKNKSFFPCQPVALPF